jgi:hypothetical protein
LMEVVSKEMKLSMRCYYPRIFAETGVGVIRVLIPQSFSALQKGRF